MKLAKVVIVGSKFGGLSQCIYTTSRQMASYWPFSKGSTRSRELSKAFGIPLFTRFDQLPEK